MTKLFHLIIYAFALIGWLGTMTFVFLALDSMVSLNRIKKRMEKK